MLEQARPNPNPMSPKVHHFATKITVRDLFALGLEQFESKKVAKVRTFFYYYTFCPQQFNPKPNHLDPIHRNLEKLCKICATRDVTPGIFSGVTLVSEDLVHFEDCPCVLEFGS